MRTTICVTLFLLALSGCKKDMSAADIGKINGYWEIEKVVLPDGNAKEYKVSTTIDYFEMKGNGGIRKKVTPQLDGTYRDNGPAETVTVSFSDGKAYLNYSSDYAKWKEEIVETADSALVFRNEGNIEYHYKRPMLFSKK